MNDLKLVLVLQELMQEAKETGELQIFNTAWLCVLTLILLCHIVSTKFKNMNDKGEKEK